MNRIALPAPDRPGDAEYWPPDPNRPNQPGAMQPSPPTAGSTGETDTMNAV